MIQEGSLEVDRECLRYGDAILNVDAHGGKKLIPHSDRLTFGT